MAATTRISPGRLPAYALLLVPAGVTMALAFRSGGFLPGATSLAATLVLLAIVLWLLPARDPLASWNRSLSVCSGSLVLLAGWTALSATWSISPELALPDAARVLLYAGVLVLAGLVAAVEARRRFLIATVALVMLAICGLALASRLVPDLLRVFTDVAPARGPPERLAYPLSYSNALGLITTFALVLLVHVSATARSSPRLRVVAAAALPLVIATLVATGSAGAAVAAVAALGLYAVMARPPALLPVAGAVAIPSAAAIWAVQSAPVLAAMRYPPDVLLAETHRAAAIVVVCALAAGALRAAALRLGARRAAASRAPRTRTPVLILLLLALVVPAGIAGASTGIRVEYWKVAAEMARAEPLRGEGAGTFALVWPRERPRRAQTGDVHSLPIETLAELGLVGFGLLGLALLVGGRALLARARAPADDRDLHCVLFCLAVAWALHAGIDWIWEQPAVGVSIFALAGAALARPVETRPQEHPDGAPPAQPQEDPDAPPPARPAKRTNDLVRAGAVAACCLAAVVTGRLALASADLEAAVDNARRGNCDVAVPRARDANRLRPTSDAYLILAGCVLTANPAAALAAVQQAVDRDPLHWRVRYDEALVRAANGLDPRVQAAMAVALNRQEPTPHAAVARFATDDPQAWRDAGVSLRFLMP